VGTAGTDAGQYVDIASLFRTISVREPRELGNRWPIGSRGSRLGNRSAQRVISLLLRVIGLRWAAYRPPLRYVEHAGAGRARHARILRKTPPRTTPVSLSAEFKGRNDNSDHISAQPNTSPRWCAALASCSTFSRNTRTGYFGMLALWPWQSEAPTKPAVPRPRPPGRKSVEAA
jgi:hypothetical protein